MESARIVIVGGMLTAVLMKYRTKTATSRTGTIHRHGGCRRRSSLPRRIPDRVEDRRRSCRPVRATPVLPFRAPSSRPGLSEANDRGRAFPFDGHWRGIRSDECDGSRRARRGAGSAGCTRRASDSWSLGRRRRDSPHMGSSRSRGDSLMRAPAHLVSSVCVGVCRYLAFGSWPRRWRARDEGQGCEAPAKPACAERTSLTRVSRSPKLAVKSEWRIEQRPIDPVHIFAFQYPGPEPDCLTRPVSEHDQPHIRSPLETAAPTSRLLRAGAQANETILPIGISGHGLPRFVHPDRQN